MVKFFIGSASIITQVIICVLVMFNAIISYLDGKYEYSIINIIFFNSVFVLWLSHNMKSGFANFIYVYLDSVYLKFRFQQVYESLKISAETGNKLNDKNLSFI